MKPKLFIGSSAEALAVAEAIEQKLCRAAECTVWSDDVVRLSQDQRDDFTRQLATSDFAAFVFAADDTIVIDAFAEYERALIRARNLPAETAIDFGCSRATRRHHVRRQTFVQSLTHSLPGIVMQAAAPPG